MISLEQIRLLEQKVGSAVELIRVLKEENATLRRGLDSAQKRMKELESLVDGFKTDQQEIESVILRTLRSLDELEEGTSASRRQERGPAAVGAPEPADAAAGKAHRHSPAESPPPIQAQAGTDPAPSGAERTPKEELDIF